MCNDHNAFLQNMNSSDLRRHRLVIPALTRDCESRARGEIRIIHLGMEAVNKKNPFIQKVGGT